MRSVLRLLVGLAVSLVIALMAYFGATGMMDSLYAFRSPLKDKAPVAGAQIGQPATRRVVFVLVDALRYDTANNAGVMPTLAELRQQGASAKMHSQTPSYSEPGYSTLLIGAWPYMHDGPAMNLDYEEIPTWTQDNLFSAASRAGLGTAVSGYYWFEKLIPQEAVTASFYTSGEDAAADREVMDAALPWLDQPERYKLVLIHIDQVDYAGHHEGGPQSVHWNEAAHRADGMIAEISARLDFQQDTLVVVSDHGQIDRGGHGGHDAVALVEPFVVVGAGVRPGTYADIQMVDVAPTIATLLGTNIPASSQGKAQTEMLALPADTLAALPGLQEAQQEKLVNAYVAAIGQKVTSPVQPGVAGWQAVIEEARMTRLNQERPLRGVVAVILFALVGWWLSRLAKQHAGWLLGGASIFFLVYHLRYAIIDRMTYSFSSVAGANELILYNAVTVGIAMIAAWLVFSLGMRMFAAAPVQAANDSLMLAFVIAWLACIPVFISFALNGMVVTWTTPEPVSFFLGLLGCIQILFVAGFGMVMAGIAALVARLTQRRHRSVLLGTPVGK